MVSAKGITTTNRRTWIQLGLLVLLTLPGIILRLSGIHVDAGIQAITAGIALVSAAFLLAYAAEAAETIIAGGLAIAILALITVLPEYAVDVIFAWNAAHTPEQAHYAVANMTGANRLLIGLGWSGAVLLGAFIAWQHGQRKKAIEGLSLPAHSVVELALLLLATIYALVLPWRGSITIFDAIILFALFGFYLWFLSHGNVKESAEDMIGPPRAIAELPARSRNLVIIGFFVLATLAILSVAEPFAEGLVTVGKQLRIDDFILVQIVAPIASEAPELVIVALFVIAGRGETGLQALVSSKVNQWTLLLGSIPIVYSISSGGPHDFQLDARQTEELLLTSAQSILAVILVLDRKLGLLDSIILLGLYVTQFAFPSPSSRIIFAYIYLVLAVIAIVVMPEVRKGILRLPKRLGEQMILITHNE
jgi:cation:H+ antiporter